jgi:hypothetical protein
MIRHRNGYKRKMTALLAKSKSPIHSGLVKSILFSPLSHRMLYEKFKDQEKCLLRKYSEPHLVVYIYNPSYFGGKDQEVRGLRSTQAKKLARPQCQPTSWI